jgi:uncharacterized protein YcbK (DUF882 family)
VTSHFKAAEFACHHCGVIVVRQLLLERLEKLRAIAGGHPIRIIDGYRCPPHNRAVGGAPNSQHMYGAAADIPSGIASPAQVMRAGFTGLGIKNGWVIHVDVRDGPVTTWHY